MRPISQLELQALRKSLDAGGPVPRDEVLALYRNHLLVEARLMKLAALLRESDQERIRTVGKLVANILEPGSV